MLVPAKITKNSPDSSRAGAVQFINLKSYDEDCLLRQCFTISITTIKTVTQTQAKPICLSKVDSFLSFTPSVLVSSCLVEVASLSTFTSVLSLVSGFFTTVSNCTRLRNVQHL